MAIDPQARRLMAMLGAGRRSDAAGVTTQERRQSFAALMRMAGRPPSGCRVEHTAVAGADRALQARVYVPDGGPDTARAGLVYFHGGGLVAGDLDTHDLLCRNLALDAGCRVVSVDYRLAPEHPFPAGVEDACAAAADVLDRASALGLDPNRVAVGGDSAGATLATVAAGALKARAGPRLACQFLLCPVLDAEARTRSRSEFGHGYLLDAELMARDLADYAPGAKDLADPRLSPLRAADHAGMPPALIHTAEFDPLRDEGELYAEILRRSGVAVNHQCHTGMIHHFYGLIGFIPAAKAALQEIARGLGKALGRSPASRPESA